MAINIVRFNRQGSIGWGLLRNGQIVPVPGDYPTTRDFVAGNATDSLRALQDASFDLTSVEILSPVTQNQQFICQGANYRQHMIESGMDPDVKKFNMIFTKATSCIAPANSPVIKPSHVRFLDYEIELGLVLKKDVTQKVVVTDANLGDFVAGLVIVNDYSARDVQIPQMQFYKGKSYRTFGPVGPYLCLLEAQDIPEIQRLELVLTVNGIVQAEGFNGESRLWAGGNIDRIIRGAGSLRWRFDRHGNARRMCADGPIALPSKARGARAGSDQMESLPGPAGEAVAIPQSR